MWRCGWIIFTCIRKQQSTSSPPTSFGINNLLVARQFTHKNILPSFYHPSILPSILQSLSSLPLPQITKHQPVPDIKINSYRGFWNYYKGILKESLHLPSPPPQFTTFSKGIKKEKKNLTLFLLFQQEILGIPNPRLLGRPLKTYTTSEKQKKNLKLPLPAPHPPQTETLSTSLSNDRIDRYQRSLSQEPKTTRKCHSSTPKVSAANMLAAASWLINTVFDVRHGDSVSDDWIVSARRLPPWGGQRGGKGRRVCATGETMGILVPSRATRQNGKGQDKGYKRWMKFQLRHWRNPVCYLGDDCLVSEWGESYVYTSQALRVNSFFCFFFLFFSLIK